MVTKPGCHGRTVLHVTVTERAELISNGTVIHVCKDLESFLTFCRLTYTARALQHSLAIAWDSAEAWSGNRGHGLVTAELEDTNMVRNTAITVSTSNTARCIIFFLIVELLMMRAV